MARSRSHGGRQDSVRREGFLILVVTGSAGYPYDRLLRKVDVIAPEFDFPFVMQTGVFPFAAANCKTFGMVGYDHFMKLFREATLIISHTSSGPLIYAHRFEKPIITVPRRKAFGEALADHQVETADALKAVDEPMRMVLDDEENMESAIRTMLEASAAGLRYTTGKQELESLQSAIRKACGI
ncbi:MAG: hypothetical protein M3Y08_14755 [Fibrobacterota bacterium]|nr:hypothetical protein [Fibrobacterota bacterium]